MRKLFITTIILLALLGSARSSWADTYLVKPDGTGDFPEIQAAIDAAENGDEILLADGVYKGWGNFEVYFWGKSVTVRSQSGRPTDCIIDTEGEIGLPRTAFLFEYLEGPGATVRDITIMNGSTATSC